MKVTLRLLSFLKHEWRLFLFSVIILSLSSVGQQYAPIFIQQILDQDFASVAKGMPFDRQHMLLTIGYFIVWVTVGSLLGYIATVLLARCANRVAEFIRNRAFDVLQRLPIAYFDDKPAGKISSRIINDTETLRSQFYNGMLSQVLVLAMPLIVIYVIVLYLNIWLGLCLLALIPIFVLWQWAYGALAGKQMDVFFEEQSEVNSQVNETMNGSEMIQLLGHTERFRERFHQVAERMYVADSKMVLIESTMSWTMAEVLKRLFICLILAVVGYQFLGQTLNVGVGEIFLYVNYTERIFNYLNMIVRQFSLLQQSMTTGRRVLELLDEPLESDSEQLLVVREGNVRFEDVSFGYVPEHQVLKHISIDAKKGETVALVGHTGSGKSSIINLLFRFYDPQEGRIMIDDQAIEVCNRESVRQEMGIVLQDPYLFTGTVASNVTMGNPNISDEQVVEALIKVGAQPLIDKLAKGIHEPVFEKGATYSSGERQLISFARTLAADPKILILDEATSHIDTETEEVIQHAMEVVKEGRTTFIVAHRLSTIQQANQILVLHEGEIVERGTHQALLALGGRYAAMYHMQQQGGNHI